MKLDVITKKNKNMRKPKLSKKARQEAFAGILFASPAILGFLIFTLGPMIASLILSFTDYAIINKPKFIGLHNYTNLFNGNDPFFYKSLIATLYYVVLSVPIGIMFHFGVALLMNRNIRGKSFFRAIYYVPSVIPIVASCTIWMWLYNPNFGLINYLLKALHLPTSQWLASEKAVVPSIVITAIWIAGNTMVVFLAGLQDIPKNLYEAIEVDGGNSMHKFIYATLPMMTPTIFFNLIMGIINGFQVFIQPLIMTDGGPNNASLFYGMYLFRQGFQFSKMGSACAIGWVLFIIIMIITAIVFKTSGSWVYYSGGSSNEKN